MKGDFKDSVRSSYVVNTVILFLVLGMMAIYYVTGATLLGHYSIFVSCVYLLNYLFIFMKKLRLYVWSTYTMLTLYMAIGTAMLGYNYGFHLYTMSTIPLIYYVQYISRNIGGQDPHPRTWSIIIIIVCVLSSLYSVRHGAFYNITGAAPIIFLGINTVSVCLFLFFFSAKAIALVTESQKKLDYQANHDALTGLSNRYYMRGILNRAIAEKPGKGWIAMIDIDNFKKINDVYGHAVGDQVLKALAAIMEKQSSELSVSRWGGEEFLIHGLSDAVSPDIVEKIRKTVEENQILMDEHTIRFTITAGVSVHQPGQPMDKWIISADDKLYSGKMSGKNRIVY